MAAAQVAWCSDDDELCPAMFVESQLDTPDAEILDRGKLLENLLTISNSGTPVIQERTEYPCPLCRGTFRALGDLVMHECPKEKPPRSLLTCCFCGFATEQTTVFRAHLELHIKPSLRCGHCNHTFPSEAVLLQHLQLHGSSLPLEPLAAINSTSPYTAYLAPQTTPILANNNGTLCVINTPTYVVPVLEDYHSRYTCTLCNAMFHRLSLLAAHGLKHSEFPDIHIQENLLLPGRGSQEPFGALMCSQCCVVFTHPVALAAHSCNCKEGEGNVTSPSLLAAPQNAPSLQLTEPQSLQQSPQQPSSAAGPSPVRLYCCPYCPYTSYLLASLIRHKEIHFSHRCSECSVRLPTLPALIQHKQKMHPGAPASVTSTPPAPSVSPVNNNGPYKRGRPRKTQEEIEIDKMGRIWHCKTCGVSLRKGAEDAATHKCAMFRCPHCTFETHKPNGLNIHINFAHTFRCQRCWKTFVTKQERTLHCTYSCPERPFKNVTEDDIPLAVLKQLSEQKSNMQRDPVHPSKNPSEHPSEHQSGNTSKHEHECQPEEDPDVADEAYTRKRGRPPKNRPQGTLTIPQPAHAEPKAVTRKRGRPRGRRK
ncbi:uncharacterized protein LOC142582964 [Dermacentor variabilis]|uniref:uncharacterized protein LOC142582964 n=1 Tax=Dermacentor variabilis TaxID=34621 RepID=UPI003F5B2DD8